MAWTSASRPDQIRGRPQRPAAGLGVGARAAYKDRVGDTFKQLGLAVSPDDCSLALRGLQTLGLRLERLEASALEIARWLAGQPGIATVLHPALPSCPRHETWKRDFSGSASVFSVLFDDRHSARRSRPSWTRCGCSRSA